MGRGKISWCMNQTRGIRLTEPKPHLSRSYMEEADDTLENVFSSTGKWKLITAYYACYNALYSILMKCGIRCEIHDCTIALMEFFGFTVSEIEYLADLKDDRIRAQYYLKDVQLKDEDDVKRFIIKCKSVLNDLDSEKINAVRKSLKT